ncbi:FtsX-like permease family protein [Proteiniclasticum sp. C24MP]|uniref:FtsX-like permease family protein n=1 Tax=Proteiniclasticum sp. C24MP TaxID=3374101 RepID=UPI003754C27B
MKQKSFFKDLKRAIYNSKSRFLSIMAMIILGVGFFAGIKAAEPDMILSADTYYKDYDLADFRIMSPLGFTEEDLEKVNALEEAYIVKESYSMDAFITSNDQTSIIKVYSYPLGEEKPLNRPMVKEGRLPENQAEIILEERAKDTLGVAIGDEVTLSLPEDSEIRDTLKRGSFKVVGFVISPLYISIERGQTNIGDGSIDFYGYVSDTDFKLDKVTDLFIETKESHSFMAYSEEYKNYHAPMKEEIETYGMYAMERDTKELRDELNEGKATLQREKAEAEEKIAEAEKELQEAEEKIIDGEQELKDNEEKYTQEFMDRRKEIEAGREALEEGREEYFAGYTAWLEGYNDYQDGAAELASSKATLDDARNQIEQGERELVSAKTQLDSAKEQIALLEETLAGLREIRANLPEGSDLTEEEYTALIDDIRIYAPDLAEFLVQNVPYNDPNLLNSLRNALDSTLVQLEETLTSSKDQYEQGVIDYEEGLVQIAESRAQYEEGLAAYEEGAAEIRAAKEEIDAGKRELDAAKAALDENEEKLDDGERQLDEAEAEFEQSLIDGRRELKDARVELAEGKRTFETEKADALEKIAEAEEEIRDAERKIVEIPDEWFVYDRDGFPGYANLGDDARRLGSLATIFPLFFFLVAALVCLTTMTRMVEEERIQIGTLKALGYKTPTIAMKYIIYALLASLIGSIIGFLVGFQLFPRVVIGIYGNMYSTPYILSPFHWDLALLSTAISVVTTVSASLFATLSELKETPAILMQPKAPKPGKRILLERFTPLWKRMSFSYKVTFRNIFRYKKRFLMTVLGISGCTALLVTGFGIRDSVNAIMGSQFDDISLYDGMVFLNTDKEESLRDLDVILGENEDVESYLAVHNESVSLYRNGSSREYEVNLMVPEETRGLGDFIDLRQRVGQEPLELSEDGAVITEKIAKLLDVSVGDTLIYRDTDTRTYEFTVSGIAENYLSHYVYMHKDYFSQITIREPEINAGLFNLEEAEGIEESAFSEKLMDNEGVLGSMLVRSIRDEFGKTLEMLDFVVLILILAAGALAFVVLYNLTNINITERIREIATIKVLGFRDKEVSAYVYRENIFLTIIGTLMGLLLGFVLHRFVIDTMELDNMMFGRIIKVFSYVVSMLLTMLFAVFVNLFMFRKLQNVDMASSLKSVE